jgi:hypothetical protein
MVLGVGLPGLILSREAVCQLGAQVGNYTIWTPTQIANVPDGGNVSVAIEEWNLTMTSGSLTVESDY